MFNPESNIPISAESLEQEQLLKNQIDAVLQDPEKENQLKALISYFKGMSPEALDHVSAIGEFIAPPEGAAGQGINSKIKDTIDNDVVKEALKAFAGAVGLLKGKEDCSVDDIREKMPPEDLLVLLA